MKYLITILVAVALTGCVHSIDPTIKTSAPILPQSFEIVPVSLSKPSAQFDRQSLTWAGDHYRRSSPSGKILSMHLARRQGRAELIVQVKADRGIGYGYFYAAEIEKNRYVVFAVDTYRFADFRAALESKVRRGSGTAAEASLFQALPHSSSQQQVLVTDSAQLFALLDYSLKLPKSESLLESVGVVDIYPN